MIKPSIRNKVLLLVINALILLVVMAGIVTWQFNRINANKETISLNSNALGDQMEADMMHDALRADVLSALHAAASKDENSSTEVSRQFVEHARRFRAGIKANEERTLDQAITAALASVDKPLEEYIQTAESLVTIAATNGVAAEAQWPAFKDAFSRLEEKMENVSEVIKAGGNAANKASNALVTQFRLTVAISLALAVLSLSLLAWYITRGIVNALDEVGQKLKQGAGQLALSANEVSGASQSLAEGASEQAASLEETSASLEEISSMTKRNSEHAANAATLGRQSRDSAAAGIERINELSLTLNSIKAAVSEMQTAVSEMQSSSQQVSKIIKTIDEIAFQTNLLALNAAVEAARAGEAGMGFAVVADEVRALAQRSAQAAKDTSEKIEAAVKRSELGVVASSKVVRSLGEVEVTAQSIQQVFTGIASQIKSLDDVIAEIAAASKEQSQGVGEVNMAVGQMDKVTQSNAAAAEENAGAANELDGQARTLQDVVARLEAVVSGRLQQDSPAAHRDDNPPKQTGKPRFQAAPKRTVIATSVNRSNARSPAPSATKVPNDRDIPMPEPDGANNNIDAFKDF